MWRVLLSCVLASCAWAQIPRDRLFSEARVKMLDIMANQPNYTCLETIERMRQAPGGSLSVQDTLRMEVALVDGKEEFAWPGAKQFEDRDLRELVPSGMFGNGNYGTYMRILFGTPGLRFEDKGTVLVGGKDAVRFDFRVTKDQSGYNIRVEDRQAIVGFHGSLYVDPENADVRRLEVIADDIPASLGLTAAEDRIDYARSVIGESEFLLPLESSLLMAGKDVVSRNRTRFSGCRKFQGESSLIFDDAEFAEAPEEVAAIEEVQLPGDTLLMLELRSDLRPKTGAIGDVIEAVLRSDVKRGKLKVAPKGAIARGRVIELERTNGYATLAIEFYDLEWPGGHARVDAKFERRGGLGVRVPARMAPPPGLMIILEPLPGSLKGELLYYRTVR